MATFFNEGGGNVYKFVKDAGKFFSSVGSAFSRMDTIVVGVSGDFYAGAGVGGDAGFYYDPETGEAGFYYAIEGGVGVDPVGVDIEVGFTDNSPRALEGEYSSVEVGISGVSVNHSTGQTGNVTAIKGVRVIDLLCLRC